jgi:hypothetical protein
MLFNRISMPWAKAIEAASCWQSPSSMWNPTSRMFELGKIIESDDDLCAESRHDLGSWLDCEGKNINND